MKKNTFIGMDEFGRCCVLKSLADFDQLCANANDIVSDDFVHSSTNWSGCDEVQRTLRIKGLELNKRILKLPKPIIFCGRDYDMGHTYPWSFKVLYIYETNQVN